MTQTPPCGPEPDELFTLAQSHVQALRQLTREIQLQSQNPQLPILTQLVLQREERLKELMLLNLQTLHAEQQSSLLTDLIACRELDPEIEAHLKQLRNKLEKQVQGLQQGKALLSRYQINNPKETGLHSQDA